MGWSKYRAKIVMLYWIREQHLHPKTEKKTVMAATTMGGGNFFRKNYLTATSMIMMNSYTMFHNDTICVLSTVLEVKIIV